MLYHDSSCPVDPLGKCLDLSTQTSRHEFTTCLCTYHTLPAGLVRACRWQMSLPLASWQNQNSKGRSQGPPWVVIPLGMWHLDRLLRSQHPCLSSRSYRLCATKWCRLDWNACQKPEGQVAIHSANGTRLGRYWRIGWYWVKSELSLAQKLLTELWCGNKPG